MLRMRRTAAICVVILSLICLVVLSGKVIYRHLLNSMCLLPHGTPYEYPRLAPGDDTNVTVVTAFFNLGTFRKGDNDENYHHSPHTYLQWARSLYFLQNPLVVFTDTESIAALFRSFRVLRNDVEVVFISDRTRLFAFQQLPRIRQIFEDPHYPKFHPNTVLPEYPCSQHAKVDVMEKALAWDLFRTKYFAWIDLGYFRYLVFRKREFWISVPPELDERKLAACEVYPPDFRMDAEEIFKKNQYWVGGGMLLATREKYRQFVAEYRHAMKFFMAAGLVNSDQQVLYAMYNPSAKKVLNVSTELQLFSWPGNSAFSRCWFYLGYHCYREQ